MRFALLGNHPDGLEMACCLVESGRHELGAYTSSSLTAVISARCGSAAKIITDLEEILADPAIEAIIVASGPANRAAHLRRSLQSERHVLCVHPPDPSPDLAHEAAMIQGDTGRVLLPLLYEALHPSIGRLTELLRSGKAWLGDLKATTLRINDTGEILTAAGPKEHRLSLPGWHILRKLNGEVAELAAFAAREEMTAQDPLLITGRFQRGPLFEASFLPFQARPLSKLSLWGSQGHIELLFPLGQSGPAFLTWNESTGKDLEEAWESWDPWPAMVDVFERAVKEFESRSTKDPALGLGNSDDAGRSDQLAVSWQDTVRSLELDDAAVRSVERRRFSSLEYPEATEEVGFKGTMTLAGCGLIWAILIVVILARWIPELGWAIVPLLGIFLVLQLLRRLIPRSSSTAAADVKSKLKKPQSD
ncbi:MAG: Gfo/Idh/MocA family oxidoreductase [Gemmataceae bacterium]